MGTALVVKENDSEENSEGNTDDRKLFHLWKKGESGNPKGRPKGVPNKATLEIKEFCRGVLTSRAYRASLRSRIKEGSLPPAIESLLFYYAYGKPKETIEVETRHTERVLVEKVLMLMDPATLRAFRAAWVEAEQEQLGKGGEE